MNSCSPSPGWAARRFRADEAADPVVDMDDEIANLQIAEVGQERSAGGPPPLLVDAAFLLEQIGLGEERDVRLRQVEAARQAAGRDEHCRLAQVVGQRDRARANPVVGEELDRAFGAARGRRDEHHLIAARLRLPNLLHPVADAAVILDRRQAADVSQGRIGIVDRQLARAPARSEPRARSPSTAARSPRTARVRGRAPRGRPRSSATAPRASAPYAPTSSVSNVNTWAPSLPHVVHDGRDARVVRHRARAAGHDGLTSGRARRAIAASPRRTGGWTRRCRR